MTIATFDLELERIYHIPKNVKKVQHIILDFLSNHNHTVREWLRLIETLNSPTRFVPPAMLHYQAISVASTHSVDPRVYSVQLVSK